jgi:hypothetical protein
MAMDTASLMGFAVLGSMKKAERTRAETPLILTLVPGAPTTRAAIATVAVGNQARDSLRREKKVAGAVLGAVEAVAAGQPPATAFAGQPALRDLAPDQLAARLTTSLEVGSDVGGVGTHVPAAKEAELRHALGLATEMLVMAIGKSKNQLFTRDEARKFDDYLDLIPGADRDLIVAPELG